MPLHRHSITIPLAKGIDTKTDAKHVDAMGLLTLENGRLDKTGTVEKRNGHTYFSHAPDVSGQAWGAMSSLFSHGGSELIQLGKSTTAAGSVEGSDSGWQFATYDSTLQKWHEIGRTVPMELSSQTASASAAGNDNPDVERANGYLCYVWENSDVIYYTLIHEATGAVIVQDQATSSAVNPLEAPKVLAIGNVFWIWALKNTATRSFYYTTLDTDALPTVPTTMVPFAAAGTPHADNLWDAVQLTHTTHGDCTVICYKDNAAGGLIVRWIDSTPTLQASVTVPSLTPPINCIGCNKIENRFGVDKLAIAWQHNPGTQGIYHQIMAMDNSWDFANPVLVATGADTARQITMIQDYPNNGASGPDTVRYFIEYDSGAWPRRVLAYQSRQDTGAAVAAAGVYWASGLASRAFAGEMWPAVWLMRVGQLNTRNTQPTLFLVATTDAVSNKDEVWAKALSAEAYDYLAQPGLSKVIQNGTDPEFMFAAIRQDRANQLQKGVSRLVIPGPSSVSVVGLTTTLRESCLDGVESGEDLIIATGGALMCKSGGVVSECGFHLYPEDLGLTTQTSGGNLTDATEYFYTAIYEWTDRAGQIHRSAPAVAQSITTGTPGTSANKVTAVIDTLEFSGLPKKNEVQVVFYRRCSDGLYHRVDTQDNDLTTGATTCTDTITDAVAITNETLYTTGGVLENIGPAATRIVTAGGGRIAYIPEEDRTLVCLSKDRSNGLGLEFAIELTRRVTEGGDATGLAYLGQSYIVFKENEIYAFGGAGPNALGIGAWSPNRKIAGNVGCTERKSIVDCGLGVAFKSDKGIYLLTPAGETKYIGAPVEDFNSDGIKCAQHVADSNHVRWYLDDADKTCLVWDYAVNQWATFTGLRPTDVAIWDGKVTLGVSPDDCYQEDSTFQDGTTDIDLKIGPAWFKPGDTLGAQRVWWVYLLGEYKSPHTLTVRVYYDYNDTVAETFTWTFTSDPNPYLMWFKPARQRCTAFRLEIEDSAQTSNFEGFSLSAIKLEIGTQDKRGPRLRASRTL